MIILTYRSDLTKAGLSPSMQSYIRMLLAGNQSTDDGFIIMVTPRDTDRGLCRKIGWRWRENIFEGVGYNEEYRCHHAVINRDNQCGIGILVPDDPGNDPAILARIRAEMPEE